uniref:Uncharacterized protein n=1 Tax=Pyricularia oryzae (strain P131) TaxID=1143193 RepID=L7JKE3_PYRO1
MLVLKQILFLLLPLVSQLATAYPISAQDQSVTARDLVRHDAASADDHHHHLQRRAEPKSRWSSSSSSGQSSSDGEGSQKTEASKILNDHMAIGFDAASLMDTPTSPPPNPNRPPNLNKPLPQIPGGQASSSGNPDGIVSSSGGGGVTSNVMASQSRSSKRPTIGKPMLAHSSNGFAAADAKEPVAKTKSQQNLRKSASKQSLRQGSASDGKGKKS